MVLPTHFPIRAPHRSGGAWRFGLPLSFGKNLSKPGFGSKISRRLRLLVFILNQFRAPGVTEDSIPNRVVVLIEGF